MDPGYETPVLCRTELIGFVGVLVSWTNASRRHGIARADARFVIEHCRLVFVQPAPDGSTTPDSRLVYVGDDAAGTALEVVAVALETTTFGTEHLCVIHAMRLRDKYRSYYEEAKRWRR